MSVEFMEKINEINKKIEKLKSFIFLASEDGFWEKLVFKKEMRFMTSVRHFSSIDDGLELDKGLSLKIVELLKEEQYELEVKLKELIKEEANE